VDAAEEVTDLGGAERLWRAALAYLDRYAGSEASLRRVLTRRALRLGEPAAVAHLVDATVARARRLGLVDDLAFAEARARRLLARGRAPAAVRAALAAKGIVAEVSDCALARIAGEAGDLDLCAAVAFARRRRIGPWRAGVADAARARRELAMMARAGFPLPVARQVLGAPSPAALLDVLAEP
jgi:regulatory protein